MVVITNNTKRTDLFLLTTYNTLDTLEPTDQTNIVSSTLYPTLYVRSANKLRE